ncbi:MULTISPECIES: STAS domain-containing protein [unclassified Methanoregula]|uniref:STAS domain-containing protein n=1 Tax=unclassified Methanoregula TaxID=2649730 RepID=UPI0009D426E8|nr:MULTISPECIES: STAS domain-containing protein [unclassified Methanoregula]OPX65377.1 MAG: STAS domain protein [Methanoregula sp. PtaB.Bin085]OPY32286.1 MAG: STAS domain protein [Methanoregula sp. PtaU1.Bin006]
MEIIPEEKGGRLVIRLAGRFDAEGAKAVAGALDRALAAGHHAVELEMGGVDYLSSAGMKVLILYHRKFSQLRGQFFLSSVNDRIGRILEITGLYSLLEISPGREAEPGVRRVPCDGWSFSLDETEGGAALPVTVVRAGEGGTILPFPPTLTAFGNGALGYDAADCAGRYGPFLAVGGFAACRLAQGDEAPDYVEYAEAEIPRLHVQDGIGLAGGFVRKAMFNGGTAPPAVDVLVQALLEAAGLPAAGFIIAAEYRRTGDGETGPSGCGDTAPGLLLAAGVAGTGSMPDPVRVLLFPRIPSAGPASHVYAAFFPYSPLRQRGPVRLKETAATLFTGDLLEIACLADTEKRPGPGAIRLLRGIIWFAPIREP